MDKLNLKFFFLLVICELTFSINLLGQKTGYVLGPNEGEQLRKGRVIKASPKSGSRNVVLVLDSLPAGFQTNFHAHKRADEFFYIIRGDGYAEIDSTKYKIAAGSIIFVPKGTAHNIKVSESGSMNMLFFFDKPGTDDWFRWVQENFFSKSIPMSIEDCNKFGKKYGYICIENKR